MQNKTKKIPSSFSLMNRLKPNIINDKRYINFSVKSCGPAENRTRDFRVSSECFTIKLLAHKNNLIPIYLNVFRRFGEN